MNKPVIIASALALVALAFAALKIAEVKRVEATAASLARERDNLQAELRTLQQRLEAAHQRAGRAEEQATTLKADLGQLFTRKEPAASVVTSATTPQAGFRAGIVRRTSPLTQRTTPTLHALETTYHVLYRQLQLSPEQIAQFKATMIAAGERFDQLDREGRQQGVSARDSTRQPLYAKADAEFRADLTQHFGPGALPAIEHFTETLFLRDAVAAHIATELFYTATPLTEAQANQLVEIMAKAMRDPAGRLDPAFAEADAMRAGAIEVLSEPQRVVWREFIDRLARTSFSSLQRPRR